MLKSIITYITGGIAFFLYAPYVGFVSSFTQSVFMIDKYIPCAKAPCHLRLLVHWLILIIHDALISLPIFFIFGFLFGILINKYHYSNPLTWCFGFFTGGYLYHAFYIEWGFLPLYVEIGRAIPLVLSFIIFTKVGHSLKMRKQSCKIAEAPNKALHRER